MKMQPVVVMPLHDPEGRVFPHLKRATPQLKRIFGQVFLHITASTRESQTAWVNWIETERFFQVVDGRPGTRSKYFISVFLIGLCSLAMPLFFYFRLKRIEESALASPNSF
jgi:hypothetical protein